jgi:hypothetical protein
MAENIVTLYIHLRNPQNPKEEQNGIQELTG